jgi:hypothetical protein
MTKVDILRLYIKRSKLKTAFEEQFEVTSDKGDKIRRMVVIDALLSSAGLVKNNTNQAEVRNLLSKLGVEPIIRTGRKYYKFIKPASYQSNN